MHEELVPHLRCPASGAPLTLVDARREGGQVVEGRLVGGAVPYPVRAGVPRFVVAHVSEDQAQTVRSFSSKWNGARDYAADPGVIAHREAWFHERFGFSGPPGFASFLRGHRRVLEVGIGVGIDLDRYLAACDATIYGLDISDSAELTHQRLGAHPRVNLLQADLGAPPFATGWFDVVHCDQVLHHTPDPPAYFERLVRVLAPGGHLLLYVYRKKGPLREFTDDHLRSLAIDAPEENVRDLCRRLTGFGRALSKLRAEVEVEDDLPELGIARGRYDVQRLIYDHVLKCCWNESYPEALNEAVNYDWYRPRHAYRYTVEDVRGWCARAGLVLEREHVAPSGISIIARRPA